jgi:uncharacterized protein YhfF
MNEAAAAYWNSFWKEESEPGFVSAWSFGASPDELAELVIGGIKTATCSGLVFYEIEQERLPQAGDYSIVLNSLAEPVAIIQTTGVQIVPMNEVPVEFAEAEGEGDGSYEYWYKEHKKFFTKALQELGREFREEMPLVCERFTLLDVKEFKR